MQKDIVFSRLNRCGRFKLSCEIVNELNRHRQESRNSLESGGILLGRHIVDSNDFVVDQISTPMHGDKQTRFSFFRNSEEHQKIIDRVWNESDGTTNYLGEWHTHPELFPFPSVTDIDDWKRKLKEDIFHHCCLFFIIVGIHRIDAWEGCQSDYNINKLKRR